MHVLNAQQLDTFVQEGCLVTPEDLPLAAIAELLELLEYNPRLHLDSSPMQEGDLN
tara:strand:+ start:1160 stop:1327 length:168 start_codon:yes stop_codon:yes gene_type:complete